MSPGLNELKTTSMGWSNHINPTCVVSLEGKGPSPRRHTRTPYSPNVTTITGICSSMGFTSSLVSLIVSSKEPSGLEPEIKYIQNKCDKSEAVVTLVSDNTCVITGWLQEVFSIMKNYKNNYSSLNSLWPSDAIWSNRIGSTLARVMAWCC